MQGFSAKFTIFALFFSYICIYDFFFVPLHAHFVDCFFVHIRIRAKISDRNGQNSHSYGSRTPQKGTR
jgi:hypothetical protein